MNGLSWIKKILSEKYDQYFENKTTVIDVDILLDLQDKICKLMEQNANLLERVTKLESMRTQISEQSNPINLVGDDYSQSMSNNSDFDKFINYIVNSKPEWYTPGGFIKFRDIYNKYIDMYDYVSTKMFTLRMKNRIFDQKKTKES